MKNKTTRISKTFVWFLITAIFFWLLIKLSKQYTTTQTFLISYSKLPQDKLLQKDPIKEVTILIKGTGFKLFTSKLSQRKIDVDASKIVKSSGNKYILSLKNQQNTIQNQLPNGLQIVHFNNENIILQLGYLASKKVAIQPNYSMQFKAGYDLIEKVSIQPDSVTITGPTAIIDTITKVYLQKKIFKNVSENISESLSLIIPKEEFNIRTTIKKVVLTAKVEKFTEGSFDVPFSIVNVPNTIKINTFPKNVKIVFKVSLKDFNRIHKEAFSVECDYKQSKKNHLNYLEAKLVSKPNLVKRVKIIPNKIDFLIQN